MATTPVRFSRMTSPTSMSTVALELQVSYPVCTYIVHSEFTFFLVTEQSVVSSEDQLFDDVRQATKEVKAAWYSLAIELDIEYGTRKVRLVCLVAYALYHLKPTHRPLRVTIALLMSVSMLY